MRSIVARFGSQAIGELAETFRFLLGVTAVYLVMVTFFFAAFHIPSESMQPTLQVGDRVMVSKFSYGYSRHSLPLGLGYIIPESVKGRLFSGTPKAGDVIVVRDPGQGVNLIKRVVGLPGDEIEMRRGRLYINSEVLEREAEGGIVYRDKRGNLIRAATYLETLPNGKSYTIYERSDSAGLDDVGPFKVPANHLFLMGDNRDASADSRVAAGLGYVHRDEVVGQAWTILFTFASCRKEDNMHCPGWRVWRRI